MGQLRRSVALLGWTAGSGDRDVGPVLNGPGDPAAPRPRAIFGDAASLLGEAGLLWGFCCSSAQGGLARPQVGSRTAAALWGETGRLLRSRRSGVPDWTTPVVRLISHSHGSAPALLQFCGVELDDSCDPAGQGYQTG